MPFSNPAAPKSESTLLKRVIPFVLGTVFLLANLGCDVSSSSTSDFLSDADVADLEAAVNELDSNPDTSGTPSTTPSSTADTGSTAATVAAAVPSNDSESFFRGVRWLRSDPAGPNARVTKSLGNVSTSSNGVSFNASDLGDWPTQGGDTHGVMALAVFRNGAWEGGKFNHVRRNTRFRDFKNVGGYLPVNPRSGEPVRFWIMNYAGTEATNFVESRWP